MCVFLPLIATITSAHALIDETRSLFIKGNKHVECNGIVSNVRRVTNGRIYNYNVCSQLILEKIKRIAAI